MRVITARAIVEAMKKHGQWKAGLKLWLDVFNTPSLRFDRSSAPRVQSAPTIGDSDPLKEVNHENNDVKRQPA